MSAAASRPTRAVEQARPGEVEQPHRGRAQHRRPPPREHVHRRWDQSRTRGTRLGAAEAHREQEVQEVGEGGRVDEVVRVRRRGRTARSPWARSGRSRRCCRRRAAPGGPPTGAGRAPPPARRHGEAPAGPGAPGAPGGRRRQRRAGAASVRSRTADIGGVEVADGDRPAKRRSGIWISGGSRRLAVGLAQDRRAPERRRAATPAIVRPARAGRCARPPGLRGRPRSQRASGISLLLGSESGAQRSAGAHRRARRVSRTRRGVEVLVEAELGAKQFEARASSRRDAAERPRGHRAQRPHAAQPAPGTSIAQPRPPPRRRAAAPAPAHQVAVDHRRAGRAPSTNMHQAATQQRRAASPRAAARARSPAARPASAAEQHGQLVDRCAKNLQSARPSATAPCVRPSSSAEPRGVVSE